MQSKLLNLKGRTAKIIDISGDGFVPLPEGTETGDWLAFILPSEIGLKDDNKSPYDDALLYFKLELKEETDGWQAYAQHKYRDNETYNAWSLTESKAKVLLIPKVYLQLSN